MRSRAEILREKLLLIEPWRNYVDLHKVFFFSENEVVRREHTCLIQLHVVHHFPFSFTVSEVTDSLELLSFAINRQ